MTKKKSIYILQNLLFLEVNCCTLTIQEGEERENYIIPSHASHSKSHFSKTGFSFKQQNHIDHKTLKGISPSFFLHFFFSFFLKWITNPIIQVLHSPILTGIFFGMSYKTDKHLSYSPEMSKINFEKNYTQGIKCAVTIYQ